MKTIIEMAREAGFDDWALIGNTGKFNGFAALVRENEREMKELTGADKAEITATVKRIAESLGTCRPVIAMNALMIVIRGIADVEGVDTEACAAAIRARGE